jgi:hypothetical protein
VELAGRTVQFLALCRRHDRGCSTFEIGRRIASAAADIEIAARLAISKDWSGEKPRPVYLREPDAKPAAGFILPRSAG